ncbi:MAG: hypothetical protein J6C97_04905 [Clostridia bacterium]|nr:hypothetical protein [Clostridia bacterium]
MDKEFFLILQKFSIDTIIFGIVICIICFFINKYGNKQLKKFSLYYPYILGIIFYAVYLLIVDKQTIEKSFSLGATSGAVATIMLSFIKTQNGKTTLADEVLKGIISEKDLPIVKEKILSSTTQEEIADIISNYAIFSMSYDQCKIFAEILDYYKKT